MEFKAPYPKKTELKQFLEQYMRNRRLADTPETYAEFLLAEGLDPAVDAEGSFRAALRAEALKGPTYGTAGEALARAGLADSGYAAERTRRAAQELSEKAAEIEKKRGDSEIENKSAYASYVEKIEKKKKEEAAVDKKSDTKRRGELIQLIYDDHIEDYESARIYAEGHGYGDVFTPAVFEAAMVLMKYRGSQEIISGKR
ncbi:MAG: hypothetical protein IJW71_01720 [Clostridia bacterium]|nr:hypothetical protein [Clostridia bacterium]